MFTASSPATFETPEHPRDRDTGHKDTGQSDKHTDKAGESRGQGHEEQKNDKCVLICNNVIMRVNIQVRSSVFTKD